MATLRRVHLVLHRVTSAAFAPAAAAPRSLTLPCGSGTAEALTTWPRWGWPRGAPCRAASGHAEPAPATSASADEETLEAGRLRLEDAVREGIRAAAAQEPAAEAAAEGEGASASPQSDGGETEKAADPQAWRWEIRKKVWEELEGKGPAAETPRPIHFTIPNFDGAEAAAARVADLPEFASAAMVKVNPNRAQQEVRRLVLEAGKTLLASQPRFRTGLFSAVAGGPDVPATHAATSVGVGRHGAHLALGDPTPHVGLFVLGSVAVDPATGARLGKGEGINEVEYAVLRHLGAADDATPVVTTVGDEQLVEGIPTERLLPHDIPVDIICTPTRVIRVENSPIPKPRGLHWEMISKELLDRTRVLRELKARIEEEGGAPLPLGPPESRPPSGDYGGERTAWVKKTQRRQHPGRKLRGPPENSTPAISYTARLFLWNLPRKASWADILTHVASATGVRPVKVDVMVMTAPVGGGSGGGGEGGGEQRTALRLWSRGMARVAFPDGTDVGALTGVLSSTSLMGRQVQAKVDAPGPKKEVAPRGAVPAPAEAAVGAAGGGGEAAEPPSGGGAAPGGEGGGRLPDSTQSPAL